ncbi:hypothetical protein SAMN06265375_101530 [Muriicola jejuensis]|nr:hypothetical protein SAMN06265375_101530 [Muriicola jejuensis]
MYNDGLLKQGINFMIRTCVEHQINFMSFFLNNIRTLSQHINSFIKHG